MANVPLTPAPPAASASSAVASTPDPLWQGMEVDPLGALLLERRVIKRSQLTYALQKQRISHEPLARLLLRLGLVAEREIAQGVATLNQLPYCPSDAIPTPDPAVREWFRRELCLSHNICPLRVEDGLLSVLIGDADSQRVMALIDRRTGLGVRLLQADFSAVIATIHRLWESESSALEQAFVREYERLRLDSQNNLSTDELLSRILHYAVAERASDIHLQPEARSIHLSFRIDGVLQPMFCMEPTLGRLTAAIKVRAGMDISDSLAPQDGRFSTAINEANFDVRVSTAVTPSGESVVLRLLPTGAYINGLEELGILPAHLPLFAELFAQPSGIILMTGPTGSGKTTTLYAGLRSQGLSGKSILTVEDPIEYALPFAVQTQVNRRAGYTFDRAITHFLRHDPDIMLVGEIRDRETAEAAMRAAETGHLVLSTLHVNSVFTVVNRMRTLGIPPEIIAESLIGVVNQRLARRLCLHCKTYHPQSGEYHASGCAHCRMSGYHGRVLLYEFLAITPEVAAWIGQGAPRSTATPLKASTRYVASEEIAYHRLASGDTSRDELHRLLGHTAIRALDCG